MLPTSFQPEQPVCPAAYMNARDGSTVSANLPLLETTGSFGFSGQTGKFKTYNQLTCSWLIQPNFPVEEKRPMRITLSFSTGIHFTIIQNPYTDRPTGISIPPVLTVYDGSTEDKAVLKKFSEQDYHPRNDQIFGSASFSPKMLVVVSKASAHFYRSLLFIVTHIFLPRKPMQLKTEERNSDVCVFDATYALVPCDPAHCIGYSGTKVVQPRTNQTVSPHVTKT
jgi:hypothetical protein